MRRLLVLFALAACNPSVPSAGGDTPDAAVPDAAVPDATPIAPPSTAMETLTAAGRLTQGTTTFDVQLGGFTRGSATAGDQTLDTVPVLH